MGTPIEGATVTEMGVSETTAAASRDWPEAGLIS